VPLTKPLGALYLARAGEEGELEEQASLLAQRWLFNEVRWLWLKSLKRRS
jgi:hypothetical protein